MLSSRALEERLIPKSNIFWWVCRITKSCPGLPGFQNRICILTITNRVILGRPSLFLRACRKMSNHSNTWMDVDLKENITLLEKELIPQTELVPILRRCKKARDSALALRLRNFMTRYGLEVDKKLGNDLIQLLAEVGCMNDAQDVFDGLTNRDEWTWSSLISAYVKCGNPQRALDIYRNMQMDESVQPCAYAFVALLKACARMKHLEMGFEIHVEVAKVGLLETDPFVGSTLVDMYAKCGSLEKACGVFNIIPVKDVVAWTALISGYTEYGHAEEALDCFRRMQLTGIVPDSVILVCSLKACGTIKARDKGQEIHSHIEKMGLMGKEPNIGNSLVDMYAKCGLLGAAQKVFNVLTIHDVVSWTSLIAGYSENGHGERALECFKQMQDAKISPNSVTFICALKACSGIEAVEEGRRIHGEVERMGLVRTDSLIGNLLIDMYAKCGVLSMAYEVFQKLPACDVVSWTTLIAGYVDHGQGEEALKLYEQMQLKGVFPNAATYVCILKGCACIRAVDEASKIHEDIKRSIFDRDIVICTSLVDMYAKCGLLTKAKEMFDELLVPDVVACNALITGYVEYGHGEEALKRFNQMQTEGIPSDEVTLLCVLKACGNVGAIIKGQWIHAQMEAQASFEKSLTISTTLVNMYAKFGRFTSAQGVFKKAALPDVVLWTALASGYVEHGYNDDALKCFDQMQLEGVFPSSATLICALKACGNVGATDKGREIHCDVERKDLLVKDIALGNCLVDMYCKLGELTLAQEVFDNLPVQDVISWNSLITGFAHVGDVKGLVGILYRMLAEGIQPNPVTFLIIQNAYKRLGLFTAGQTFHETMSKDLGTVPKFEHQSGLIGLLCQAGYLQNAVAMIRKMSLHTNPILWHMVLSACCKWRNMQIGNLAFHHAVTLNEKDALAYTLMSNIYACAVMQE